MVPPTLRYPYPPEARLAPTWSSRRSRIVAVGCILCALAAVLWRGTPTLAAIDDLALRVGLPVMLAFVLGFAPRPATAVGAIAVDLTIAGLLASTFLGDAAPLLLLGYPLLLALAVLLGRSRTGGRAGAEAAGDEP